MESFTQSLRKIEERYDVIGAQLADPETVSDPKKLRNFMQEYAQLTPLVEKFRAYCESIEKMKEAEGLMDDPDLGPLAKEEYQNAKGQSATLEKQLHLLMVEADPNDQKGIAMEIRAGAGGEEAAIFCGDLYRMYCMYADKLHFQIEPVSASPTELGGYREIRFLVEGEGAYSRFKFESGVHRVQRVPVTETSGRIHTSTVTVAVLPEAEEVEVHISPSDLQFETCKSSGAGGQHINKTESAVRILHKPTGIVVECQEERSQFKNRDKAMKMLCTLLYDREQKAQMDAIASKRKMQVGTGDRSEKIRTYNFPQGRVTDHRIGLSLYNLDSILNGEIGGLIDALTEAYLTAKLYHDNDHNA